MGTFLASQADDRSVIIWRIADWVPVARISEPFERWISLTFSLRCATAALPLPSPPPPLPLKPLMPTGGELPASASR